MKELQMLWAAAQSWYRSSRNVAAYRDGEWWEVTVFDPERECEVQFDSFKALKEWSLKQ
jgi:hypothetical protein